MDKHPVEKGIEGVIRTYELLDKIRLRRHVAIRDDQFDYGILTEAIINARKSGYRLAVIDTGRFEASDVEWLIREGARLLTSDRARTDGEELSALVKASRKARSSLAFFHGGRLEAPSGEGPAFATTLGNLLREGMDLHLSNREFPRDFPLLTALAESAAAGRGYLVYHHLGRPGSELIALAAAGAWIQLPDRGMSEDEDFDIVLAAASASRETGRRVGVHIERGLPLDRLESLWASGTALLFKTEPSDYASLQRPFERKAARRRLPPRVSYLTSEFLP